MAGPKWIHLNVMSDLGMQIFSRLYVTAHIRKLTN